MKLQDLTAKDVMLQEVVTVGPQEKIGHVDLMMTRASIGGVPVVNSANKLIGIITQRDIMLSRFAASIATSTVEDLMSKTLVTCQENSSLKEVLERMISHNIERIHVVDSENKLKGLIVHKNILKKLYEYLQVEQ